MVSIDPVATLERRLEFLEGIAEIAFLSNWAEEDIEGLKDCLLEEIIRIDNLLLDIYNDTGDRRLAFETWVSEMEDLKRWVSLIFQIKIKFV